MTTRIQRRRTLPASLRRNLRPVFRICFVRVASIALAVTCAVASPSKSHKDDAPAYVLQVEAPPEDVLKAVEQVTQDQIIHGTYSYEKERILYGAHSAGSARVFGAWTGQGKVFYKVADKVLSPRYFKDSEDIGTISVRYVVQQIAPTTMTIQIDAVFVDARNVHHPSQGQVEAAEFGAIREHVKNIEASRQEGQQSAQQSASATVPLTTGPAPSQAMPLPENSAVASHRTGVAAANCHTASSS